MRLEASDIRNLNLLKHYRIIRKWACKNNDLNDADLELLIYFDCMDLFTREDFKIGMKFAELFGMKQEGLMEKYGLDGKNYFRYVRIN